MMDLSEYRLSVGQGGAVLIPKYGIEHDAQYFDLPSLVRMYGEEEVRRYLRGLGMELRSRGGSNNA